MFQKILIANRGEIACRVMRTAKELGISTVAVFSDADANALHVHLADEAVHLGGAAPADSYLNMQKIVSAAVQTGAEAVHPGYGFLSENAGFSALCEEKGLTFIGPPARAIKIMGSKSAARQAMLEAGMPLLPGSHEDASDAGLQQAADEIGYPVLLKAAAGGGGKGMREVQRPEDFAAALAAARREASSSFGDDQMLLEKLLLHPRHVEVQVFCDTKGGAVYLFERDCSVQRRHQKIIEEAPAPGLSESLRAAMGEAALQAAKAVDYAGAGTVEFLLDTSGNFYFMEMNTRLQVEHPVTEMITGRDLVAWQLRVAGGEPLPLTQSDLRIDGHAFEARIYAEDPENDFLPTSGKVNWLLQPETSAEVRIDTGIVAGDEIGVFYDPMIAKLIVRGHDRDEALQRLRQALADYHLGPVKTNIDFLRRLAGHPAFAKAELSTGFIPLHQDTLFARQPLPLKELLPLAALYLILKRKKETAHRKDDPTSPWNSLDNWRVNHPGEWQERLLVEEEVFSLGVRENPDGSFVMQVSDETLIVRGQLDGQQLTGFAAGRKVTAVMVTDGRQHRLFLDPHRLVFRAFEPEPPTDMTEEPSGGLAAPMHGALIDIQVQAGSRVEKGQTLLVMEAMKMEHAIMAPKNGTVTDVYFKVGDLVDAGRELLAFVADDD